MKNIVITGSSRGIGLGMAQAFLENQCDVVISARNRETLEKSARSLQDQYGQERVICFPCDMTKYADVLALWDFSQNRLQSIDIWVNNAGITSSHLPLWELPITEIDKVIQTNINGVIYGSHVAINGMLAHNGGCVYNMEGFGSDGRKTPGMTTYGTSKFSIRYFTESLAQEVKNTNVLVGAISPGMVVTDLLKGDYTETPANLEKNKKIFNILADKVETVAPWLVEKMLTNQKNGARISWLTTQKVILRFLSSPFNKRNIID